MGATDLSVLPQRSVVFPETVFRGLDPADVPLRVEGVVSQTGNLQEWRDSNGITLAKVGPAGQIRAIDLSNTPDTGPYLNLASNQMTLYNRGNAAYTPFAVRGMASQTGNLQEWQNNAGTAVARIGPQGDIVGSGSLTMSADVSARVATLGPGVGYYSAALSVLAGAYGGVGSRGIVVRGSSGQTGNLQEWQDSAGTARSWITAGATFFSGNGESNTFGTGCFTMRSNGGYGFAGDIVNGGQGIVIRNMGSSGDGFKLWNSGNGNLFYVNNAGNVYGTGGYNALSDLSAKENIVSISTSSALDSVTRLRPVKFDYIESSKDQLGFIAQEVAPVIPEAVSNFSEDQLALNDSAIIATLVAAVQELAQKVNALEAKN